MTDKKPADGGRGLQPVPREGLIPLGELEVASDDGGSTRRDTIWREASGGGYRTFKPVPSGWMLRSLSEFMARMFDPAGLASPPSSALSGVLTEGLRRFDVMTRRSAVGLFFRRVLESWRVCDFATPLIEAGFDVSIDAFCDRTLTPRNLLLNAIAPA